MGIGREVMYGCLSMCVIECFEWEELQLRLSSLGDVEKLGLDDGK